MTAGLRQRLRQRRLRVPVLLHIGVPKSATTALQNSLASSRDALHAAGVLYPDLDGRPNHHRLAVQLLGRTNPTWNADGRSSEQLQRLKELASGRGVRRVVISSEFLAEADVDEARRAVRALGRKVHVLITLRSIPQILPSSWQQGASAGRQRPFEEWLGKVLRDPEGLDLRPVKSMRGDDGLTLLSRWVSIVGARNVTVLVPDPQDHGSVFRAMESLLDVEEGTLATYSSNKSLTFTQCEIARLVGAKVRRRITNEDRIQLVQLGFSNGMKWGRSDGGPRVSLPEWAVGPARRAGMALKADIERAGVTVIGDLDELARAPRAGSSIPYAPPKRVSVGMIADGLEGVLDRAAEPPYRAVDTPADEQRGVDATERSHGVTAAFASAAGLSVEPVLPPALPAAITVLGDGFVAWEPATTVIRRRYQEHLIAGGTLGWEEFVRGIDLAPASDPTVWSGAASTLRAAADAMGAPLPIRQVHGNSDLRALAHELERAHGLEPDALAASVGSIPDATLLTNGQLELLRTLASRDAQDALDPDHDAHAAPRSSVLAPLVAAMVATAGDKQAPLALPMDVADALDQVDRRAHDALMSCGDAPRPVRAATGAVEAESVTDIATKQAVAAVVAVISATAQTAHMP
ncbi:hypothetical protein [Demequina iriomotensis]|uniref:hypothetical protein n=1 Tax=Demequina iriomotensis TaxID=1536641 RepID=UPI0007839EB1|nr:hypothetical protein [Demequina iriomotensis]